MSGIRSYMSHEHGKCDEQFATAEQLVSTSKWPEADAAFSEFARRLERHFVMEERVLFRYLESTMGSSGGPLGVMKMEHGQMRGLLQSLTTLLEQKDKDGFLGTSETMLILMQQHNMKEEQIVYPMAERMLSSGHAQVIAEMESV